MTDILPFNFENKPIRVIEQDGEPWFVAADVCRVLELERTESALRVLDEDEKGTHTVSTPGGSQEMSIISEPGLYKLLGRSRKPEAKRFDRWVRHEVLPSIRKHGGYMIATPNETPEELALRALTVLQATVERQKAQLEIAQPKVEALDRISTAAGSLNITESSKALQVRPKDLFEYLAHSGWIYKRHGSPNWLGYQSRVLTGDVEHKVSTLLRADGSEKITEQVRITPKGLAKLAQLMPGRPGAIAA